MIDAVDKVYSIKTSHTLRIATEAPEPLNFLVYNMVESEYDDPDYALNLVETTIDERECEALKDRSRRQINARCGGLLEVKPSHMVEFIHRTVRDFLLGKEMSEHLAAKSKPGFSTSISILRAYVALTKSNPQSFVWERYGVREVLRQALQYANDALERSPDAAFEHIAELGRCAMNRSAKWDKGCDAALETDDRSLGSSVFQEAILRAGGRKKFVMPYSSRKPQLFRQH